MLDDKRTRGYPSVTAFRIPVYLKERMRKVCFERKISMNRFVNDAILLELERIKLGD